MSAADRYRDLSEALAGAPLPAAVVDLDAVEANLERLVAPVRRAGKTLRVATKSVRCVALLEHLFRLAPDVLRGLMCYTAPEAAFLAEHGFDDLLVAYPTVQASDLELFVRLTRDGRTVRAVIDDVEQMRPLAERARRDEVEVPVVIDLDASLRPLGGALHLGVRRSPLHDPEAVVELAERVRVEPGVRFGGVLAYEAQIAGLPDDSPFSPRLNPAKSALRKLSRRPVERSRRAVRDALERAGFEIALLNGGGTGSLDWAVEEPALTEVTAGSGFLDSHLFDYYRHLELTPAIFFALQVTRRPGPGFVTCHGGGYVASGEAGPDRLPRPWLPEGLALVELEGAGEVQTPLRVPGPLRLPLGAPVFFRPAKAGELAERFDRYRLVRGRAVERTVPTYRGEGRCFP